MFPARTPPACWFKPLRVAILLLPLGVHVQDGSPRDLAAARAAAHVGGAGRDEENEEEDVDPAEDRVEGHVREGRDDRADDTADEGDDGEHEDEDPEAALDCTAAAIGIVVPHAKFAFVVPVRTRPRGLRCECSRDTKPSRELRCEGKPRTLRLC